MITKEDLICVLNAVVREVEFNKHNTSSYSDMLEHGISKIMTEMYSTRSTFSNDRKVTAEDEKIQGYNVNIDFKNVQIGNPIHYQYLSATCSPLFPSNARRSRLPYVGKLTASVDVKIIANFNNNTTAEKTITIDNLMLGDIPIMVNSSKCNTYEQSKNTLRSINEDPSCHGGYFIARGLEWIIDWTENVRHNSPRVYKKLKHNERARLEIMSQPGGAFDNSSLIRIRFMTNGQLTIELKSMKFKENIKVPFFLFYRIYDMMVDKDIVNTIVIDYKKESVQTIEILKFLEIAFHNVDDCWKSLKDERNKEEIVKSLAVTMSNQRVSHSLANGHSAGLGEEISKWLYNDFMTKMDDVFLPHMGKTAKSRYIKLKYLGDLINKLFQVELGFQQPSDRDNICMKRMHGAGISVPKAFKTQFNDNISAPMRKAIQKELKSVSFSSIKSDNLTNIIKSSFIHANLSRAMVQSITSNSEKIIIRKKESVNRVSSQQVERKNQLNMVSSLRNIVSGSGQSSNKTTTRADEMRRVHPTYAGYICICQSADTGDKVGMRKQLGITATICLDGDSLALKIQLLNEDGIVPLAHVIHGSIYKPREGEPFEINEFEMSKVYINGELIGYYRDRAYNLAKKYRNMRRRREIDIYTSIYVDPLTNELEFWLDVGRLVRPIIIVYNNIDEYDEACIGKTEPVAFKQHIKLTKDHIKGILNGSVNFDTLIDEQVIEYISPEEASNCYLADSIDTFYSNQDNITKQFTHLEIQQSILGLAALMTPYGDHSNTGRITLATNHQRQAGGWYAMNYNYRSDKNRFLQFSVEMPLVTTFTNRHIVPSSYNTYIAYCNFLGENMEDSAVFNKASAERGMFSGVFFKTETVELEKNWEFANPNPAVTKNIKTGACYSKLVNGFVPKGTIIKTGDIIIGVIKKITKAEMIPGDERYEYIDKSVQYTLGEDAFVDDVYATHGTNDVSSGVVKLKIFRLVTIGDKTSSRSGNKSIIARIEPQSNMLFTEDGTQIDAIINPHSFPSRMAIGQLQEAIASIIAAYTGKLQDGTTFLNIYAKDFQDQLVKLGLRFNGLSRVRNGITGEYFDAAIFIAPTAEQRLQKFVNDDEQYIGASTPTDRITRQPRGGKQIGGGLRLGEMEVSVLDVHGGMNFEYEKMHTDADGRIAYICRGCNCIAVYNEFYNIYKCKNCEEKADIEKVESTHISSVIQGIVKSSGITMEQKLAPRMYDN